MVENVPGDKSTPPKSPGSSRNNRRNIYIKERLPAVAAEMKLLSDERKLLMEKRKQAEPNERREMNHRWNYLAARLDALREERAALVSERDGTEQVAATGKNK